MLKSNFKIILAFLVAILLIFIGISKLNIQTPEQYVKSNIEAVSDEESSEEKSNEVKSESEEEKSEEPVSILDKQDDSAKESREEKKTEESTNSAKNSEGSSTTTATESLQEKKQEEEGTVAPSKEVTPQEVPSVAVQEAQSQKKYCTVSIDCYTVLQNKESLKSGKENCLGNNGLIFSNQVEITEGETVLSVLLRLGKQNGISIANNSGYIKGINKLYEKDCGPKSGWMYSVNGTFPSKGVSVYTVSAGDNIAFRYSCDSGNDLN